MVNLVHGSVKEAAVWSLLKANDSANVVVEQMLADKGFALTVVVKLEVFDPVAAVVTDEIGTVVLTRKLVLPVDKPAHDGSVGASGSIAILVGVVVDGIVVLVA